MAPTKNRKEALTRCLFSIVVRPAWAHHLGVKVPCGSWWWKPLAKSKGVYREVESEGSRRQTTGPTNRNCIPRLETTGRACNTRRSP
ncbi:MAG: hypothetical protein IBX64_10100 [Actinobacteria bacterium]|nr:hypothetical protein [Actinomycetota bacterium]